MVELLQQGLTKAAVARATDTTRSTVTRWTSRFNHTGAIHRTIFFGSSSLLCGSIHAVALWPLWNSVAEGPRGHNAIRGAIKATVVRSLVAGRSARAIAARHTVSPRSVTRIAVARGARYLSTTRATPLTDANKRQRLRFARYHLATRTNWNEVTARNSTHTFAKLYPSSHHSFLPYLPSTQVIFSDETAIQLPGGARKAWTMGERGTRVVDGYAPKIMFWAALGTRKSEKRLQLVVGGKGAFVPY